MTHTVAWLRSPSGITAVAATIFALLWADEKLSHERARRYEAIPVTLQLGEAAGEALAVCTQQVADVHASLAAYKGTKR